MKKLVDSINTLKKTEISDIIKQRSKEFKKLGRKSNDELFKEMCFCILTANYNALGGIRIQNQINDGFLRLPERHLAKRLTDLGHRFPNVRANYIFEARKHKDSLQLERDWIVENIKGIGMKEASHFLRNIGHDHYAIIDFHIVDVLERHGIIKRPKTMTKKNYLEIEDKMKELARKTGLNLSELDMYLWYLETGKILK